ncbi:MAG TPA: glycosyltransferase [Trueperaceae bacterium]|jgi:cellulose synthase/poly-beta-1,6-N-acetylglucosamine synthase-like glycosyltransferase
MAQVLAAALLLLAVPLVAAQAWVIWGMFRPDEPRGRRASADPRWRLSSPTPSVSVVVPAHDEEARLPRTLASLARLDYPGPIEFVIVDDRSTDGTAAVVERFAAEDPRFRLVRVREPSRRYAPKVNAVMAGVAASRGEVIATTDADCGFSPGWVSALVRRFTPGVVMVCGFVETLPPGELTRRTPFWRLFEAADWFSLMLVSRSLLRHGHAFASSANNQAYLRSALEAAGGFGASARAPSGDEDLLAQRLGALPGARVVFADEPDARAVTASAGGPLRFLRQRSRWVSRYRHAVHYRPAFLLGLVVLGFESLAVVASVLALPLAPELAPVVLGCYATQTAAMVVGMTVGARQLGRPYLGGLTALAWALLHPWLIATAVLWSWVAPADWRAGAVGYRRSIVRRRWRLLLRALSARPE